MAFDHQSSDKQKPVADHVHEASPAERASLALSQNAQSQMRERNALVVTRDKNDAAGEHLAPLALTSGDALPSKPMSAESVSKMVASNSYLINQHPSKSLAHEISLPKKDYSWKDIVSNAFKEAEDKIKALHA